MANVDDSNLRSYTKSDDFKEGDKVVILDEGKWDEVDFSPEKNGSKIKKVFQVNVRMPNGDAKLHTMNATSLKTLREAWTPETSAWKNRVATATFVKQMSFGKLTNVLVLMPTTEFGK